MITLNKVSHPYNINFLNMMKPTLYIFCVLVWKRFEEEFLDQSSWNPEILLKVFAYYSKVHAYFL